MAIEQPDSEDAFDLADASSIDLAYHLVDSFDPEIRIHPDYPLFVDKVSDYINKIGVEKVKTDFKAETLVFPKDLFK